MYEEKSGFNFGKQVLLINSARGFETLVELLLTKNIITKEELKAKLLETDGVEIKKVPTTKKYKMVEVNEETGEAEGVEE